MRETLKKFRILLVVAILWAALGGIYILNPSGGEAGPEIVGNPAGSNVRAIVSGGSDKVVRIVYFSSSTKTMAGANTPVASSSYCRVAGTFHYAQVDLTGTMTGTNPTLTIKWQNSKDNGSTWNDVGSWTEINSTVTPASQSQTVADIAAATAVTYGDCWRALYTFAGTGTVTANFKITGMDK